MRKESLKTVLTVSVFLIVLFGLGFVHLFAQDLEVSTAERRKLAQMPEISWEAIRSGKWQSDLESYLLDHFPARDTFRSVKAVMRFYVYGQKDNNDVYLANGSVQKLEYPLNEKQLKYGANKLNEVYETYLQGMNVYYAVIPDKNYFTAQENGYPYMDYDLMRKTLRENLAQMQEIELFDCLKIEDYYRTDSHWKQENLFPVVDRLAEKMGFEKVDANLYTQQVLEPFYGVYCGQSALPVGADTLTYLISAYTQNASVTSLEFSGTAPVYTTDRFSGMDGYDVFLSGAQALLTIECPNAKSEKELILFRDSYGSSLAPLLTGSYSKITLVDLRYIPAAMLGDYIEFANQDVLFLYSTTILNSAMLLK